MRGRFMVMVAAALAVAGAVVVREPRAAGADGMVEVATGAEFVAAVEDTSTDEISLAADVVLASEPVRPGGADALVIRGNGFSVTAAPASAALRADGVVGDLVVQDLVIEGAESSAVRWVGGSVAVTGSTFTSNRSEGSGGAIFADGAAEVSVADSTFVDNSASVTGGAIWTTGKVEVRSSTFEGNEAAEGGGAIRGEGEVELEGSALISNRSPYSGGAISAAGNVRVVESSLADNEGGISGGAIITQGRATVVASTVAGNTAEYAAGTLSGDLVLAYATYADNVSLNGTQAMSWNFGVLQSFGSVVDRSDPKPTSCSGFTRTESEGYNVETRGRSCGFDAPTDRAEMAFPQTSSLVSDGRLGLMAPPVRSDSAGGDSRFVLVDAIPAAGCRDGGASAVGADQRRMPRPQGLGCDIGAVELEVQPRREPDPQPVPSAPSAAPAQPVAGDPTFTG